MKSYCDLINRFLDVIISFTVRMQFSCSRFSRRGCGCYGSFLGGGPKEADTPRSTRCLQLTYADAKNRKILPTTSTFSGVTLTVKLIIILSSSDTDVHPPYLCDDFHYHSVLTCHSATGVFVLQSSSRKRKRFSDTDCETWSCSFLFWKQVSA